MPRNVNNLGELIKVIKELNEPELSALLLKALSNNSIKVRKESLSIMRRKLIDNDILISDNLIIGFVGELVEAV